MPNKDGTGPRGQRKMNRRNSGACLRQDTAARRSAEQGKKRVSNANAVSSKSVINGETLVTAVTAFWGLATMMFTLFRKNKQLPGEVEQKKLAASEIPTIRKKTEDTPEDQPYIP